MSIDYKSSNDPIHLLPENIKKGIMPENLNLEALEIDIKKMDKRLSQQVSLSNLDSEELHAGKNEAYAISKILPSMIRTSLQNSVLSVPRTVFYVGSHKPEQRLINKKPAQRYIGVASVNAPEKTFVVTDVYGSYMGSSDVFATQVKGEDEYVKVFDFVTRWPMDISLLRKNFRFSEKECVNSFGDYYMKNIKEFNYAMGSIVTLNNSEILTYEINFPNVITKKEYEFLKGRKVEEKVGSSLSGIGKGFDTGSKVISDLISFMRENEDEINVYSPKFLGSNTNGEIDYGHNQDREFNVYSLIY